MKDLWKRLETYTRAYLPWWRCEGEQGEPEEALLTALGSLLEETAALLDRLPEKHELEFLRAFGVEGRPAEPALAWAALSAPRREHIPPGTEFYLSGDGKRLWRTQGETWAGPCRLAWQVLAGREGGKLIPAPPPGPDRPTRLFDFRPGGAQRREARFSHPDAFASEMGCSAALVFPDGEDKLLQFLAGDQTVSWFLEGGGERLPLDSPRLAGKKLLFRLPPSPAGETLLCRAREGAAPPAGIAGAVFAETCRENLPAGTVLTEEGTERESEFLPFGEEPELWRTCCLSCGDALSLRGAEVKLSWTASLGSRETLLPGLEQNQTLKPVMRRLPPEPPEIREVYADAVAWEYWDGGGWRTLEGAEKHSGIFGPLEKEPARLEVSFPWPGEAKRCAVQGREGYWLRWRIRGAEGCGLLPRRSRFPVVTDLKFSAVLRDGAVKVERRCGLEEEFSPAEAGRPLFPAEVGPEDAWWLGFDPPPAGESLTLWLTLEGRTPEGGLTAWEALAGGGERPLILEDGTGGLCHSGAISLRGIRGERAARFGRRLWWLCLRDKTGALAKSAAAPILTAVDCGAVLLCSEGEGSCTPGEPLRPLRGGVVSGKVCTGDFGGCREEGEKEILCRTRNLRRHLGRGASACDVEGLLQDALPDVARARCVRTEGEIEVGVLLRDAAWHSAAFEHRKGEIARILRRETALPTLGLEIAVKEAHFYAIHTSVWLAAPEGADPSTLEQAAREALEGFLHPVTGGREGRGWPLGRLPGGEELKAALSWALGEVELAELLVAAAGPDGREREAERVEDPFALPISGHHTIKILKAEV